MQLTDEELMNAFASRGKDDAFSKLYEKYFPLLSKYMGWLANNMDQGKDIAQNVLLKVYQNPASFDASRNFKVWIFSMAKNLWKNELRSEAIQKVHNEQILYQSQLEEEPMSEDDNKKAFLKKELTKLSENHKEVFILKYSNNLTIKEISEVCACSEGTVKSRLFYALKQLKGNLNLIKV